MMTNIMLIANFFIMVTLIFILAIQPTYNRRFKAIIILCLTTILIVTTSLLLSEKYTESPQDHFKVRDTVRINLEAPGSKPFVMREKDGIYTVPLNQEFTRTKSVPSDEIHVVDVPGQSAFAVPRYDVNKLWYNPGTWFLDDLATYVWYK